MVLEVPSWSVEGEDTVCHPVARVKRPVLLPLYTLVPVWFAGSKKPHSTGKRRVWPAPASYRSCSDLPFLWSFARVSAGASWNWFSDRLRTHKHQTLSSLFIIRQSYNPYRPARCRPRPFLSASLYPFFASGLFQFRTTHLYLYFNKNLARTRFTFASSVA